MQDQHRNALQLRLAQVSSLGDQWMDLLFHHPSRNVFSWIVSGAWLAFLFVFGIYLWGVFYSWGNIAFDFSDWAEVTGPRFAVLQDAAVKGELPLHVTDTTATRGVTDRFLSIADTPLSPQFILLRSMEIGQFSFYNTVLFYALGFLGLLFIFRKYRLSVFAFTALFFLFMFNGHISTHLAVGHANWVGHFLLPYFILLVFHLIEQQGAGWRWVLGLGITLLVILLQGGFHLYVWCLIFLAVLGLFNWRLLKPVLLGGLFTGLISLPRLLPPMLALEGITQEYLGGFASISEMISSLIFIRDPDHTIQTISILFPLNGWEEIFYIGFLGAALILTFGVILPLRECASKSSFQVQVLVPSLILTVFSVGQVFSEFVRVFTFPPLTGERVTSRMFFLPLSIVLVLAVIFLQKALDRRKIAFWQGTVLAVLGYMLFHDLNQHLRAWRIRYLDGLVHLFPKVPFDEARHTIGNHPDAVYTNLLIGGLGVAVLALIFLLVMAYRSYRQQRSSPQPA